MQRRPSITVVVCTRDRPGSLARCLEALGRLDYPDFEVVVVDNAPGDRKTASVVASTPFRYVREDRPGLNRARQRGADEAAGAIIAFADDDVVVDSGWLHGLALGFAEGEVGAVTGLVLPAELETPAQRLFQAYGNGMSRGFVPRTCNSRGMSPSELIAVQHLGVGANMAFRSHVLKELGGFDPALDVGTPSAGGGDLDILHRVLVAGWSVRYEPSAVVWHYDRAEMPDLRRKLHGHGRGFGAYLIKRWREAAVPRAEVARYALGTWIPWLVGRLVLRMLGRHALPCSLLWAELQGAVESPLAYRAAVRMSSSGQ